ncbi:MAG: hypothetical protein NVSMB53_19570 [Gemmatimonadaceae bacterium]
MAVALLGVACASPGMPPGGPPHLAAPQIVAIIPDSGSVGVKPKEVVFRFDEVVAERPPAATTLSDLFLISPRDGVPDASWHRDAIGVKPTHGWRENTPYTVIILPGLADIRGNVRNTGASTFFSTGRTIPRTRIVGDVFDWVSGSPAKGALVEALVPPDSVHPYIALVDSNGLFVIEHLPAARYMVRAYSDRNRNLAVDPSEPWDSVSVGLADSARINLFIFVHDTLPPKVRDVRALDSLTLQLTFDKPVDPTQTLTTSNFAVIGPDTSRVTIVSAGPPPRDTAAKVNPAPAVSPTARRDTKVIVKPVMARPLPITEILIKLQHPLTPKVLYHVRAIGIRGLTGRTGDSDRGYTPQPPSPAAPAKPAVKPNATPPALPPPERQ